MVITRRNLLKSVPLATITGVAGCLGAFGGEDSPRNDNRSIEDFDEHPRLAEHDLYIHYDYQTLSDSMVRGVVRRDGIPSIDDPSFIQLDEAELDADDPVIGVELNGEKKAYSHRVLVRHEIVNDQIGGENIAVTYCPLTATPQGFYRGETELGVSGHLLTSNLVMWDRTTESLYPQMLATGLEGPMKGKTLAEFNVHWTTWGEWSETHPDTLMLSEDTESFLRNYNRDPYGSYNPRRGYYANEDISFPTLNRNNDEHPKEFVIGTRDSNGALAFNLEKLQQNKTLTGEIQDTEYIAVADTDLGSGYVYQNPDSTDITHDRGNTYRANGETYHPSRLPLTEQIAYNSFWFAWYAYYPTTSYIK